mgnify:FL=1
MTRKRKDIATGHYDCCGEMICRHDLVVTSTGQAAVLWVGNKWMLRYTGGAVEELNQHGAADLRRVAKSPAAAQ